MKKNYSYNLSTIRKVSVTISLKALWENFVISWGEFAWDNSRNDNILEEVADVLLSGDKLDIIKLRKIFRDGYTYMLMGDAMDVLDHPVDEVFREIIVVDVENDNKTYKLHHEDINF